MTEYHGRHNTAATKGIKMARWVGLIDSGLLFLGSRKTPKSKVHVNYYNDHFQAEHWPGADNSLWQYAHQCNQAWRKAYVGRCLKSFYIFNHLVVGFLIILIVKIIWESTTLRSGGIDFQRIGQFLGEIVQILWPSKVFENQTLLSLWKLSNTLIKYWSVT